jgi:hypothetical protein
MKVQTLIMDCRCYGAAMARRTVIQSDLSGKDIPEDQHVRLIVTEHPALNYGRAELDISKAEAERFQTAGIDLVHAEVHTQNEPRRHVVMLADQFNGLFKDTDVAELVNRARVTVDPARTTSAPRAKRGTGAARSDGEKRDYSSPEWAGVEHRGRVTEAEANFVRNNLEAANANRARESQPPINATSDKMVKRYGL